MARTKRSMRCVGVALMALMMVFAMTVGSFAMTDNADTTIAYTVEFFKEDGSSSMANNTITGDAIYDSETQTLTIPIEKQFMMRPYDGGFVIGYGCLMEINITGTDASGTAAWDATQIVINNFEPNADNVYSTTMTVEVQDLFGNVVEISDMIDAVTTMTLTAA